MTIDYRFRTEVTRIINKDDVMPINFKKWLFAFATTFAICAASLTILFRITNETQNRRADADVEATYSKSQDDLKYAEELEEPTPSDATNEILPNSVFGDNVFISIKDSDDETTSMEASDEPVQTEVDETALFEPNFEDEQTTSRGAGFDFSRMRQFDELFGEIDSSVESAHDEMQDATPNDDEELFVDDSGLNIDLDVEESALSEASDAADRPAAVANEDDQSSIEATSEVDGSNAAEPSVDELVEVESAAPEIESTPSVAATHGVILASKDVFDAEGRALYSEGLGDDFIFEPQTEFENDAQDNVAADVEADNLSETNQVAEDVDEILFDSNDAPADVERDANAADTNPEVGDSTAEETTEIVPNESDEPAIDLRDALNVDEIADADDFVFESNEATTDEESVDSVDDSDAQNGVEESVGESVVDSSEETTEVDEFDSEEAVADGSEAPESDAILAEPEDDILFDAAESAVKEEATEAQELDETDEIDFDSNEVPVAAAAPEIEEAITESADAETTDEIDFDTNEVPVDTAAPEIEKSISESADAETTDEIVFDSNEVPAENAAPEIEKPNTKDDDDEIIFDSNESFDDDEIIFDSNASDADDASEEENDADPFDVESEHESLGVLLYDSAFSEFKTYERVETREAYEAQIDDVKADAREASATANAPVLLYDSSERGEFENGDAEKEADARQSTEEFLKALEDCAAGSALKTSETVGRVAERFEEEDPESTEVEAAEERKEEEVVDDDADELDETTNESDPSTAAKQAESQAAVEFFNAPENKSTPSRDAQALSVARANVEVEDEFWVALANPGSTMLWRYDAGRWIQESEDVFFGTDDESRVTVFWAHGYQTDMTAATRGGAYLKSTLDRARRAIGVDRKFRVVVWKWASERFTMRIKRDAETKRILTNYYGAELGEFVGRLKPGDDVTFVGFSFGASVVGAALQTLATRPNRYLSSRMEEAFAVSGVNAPASPLRKEGRISLILASAGCDAYAFGRGGAFEMGGQLPTTVLNVYNPRDFVLKFYPAVAGGAQALGIAPVANEAFPNAGGRVYNLDVQTVLNREHSFEDALGAVPINYTATLVW